MPCYHPMTAEWTGEYTENHRKKYKFLTGEKHEIPKSDSWRYIKVPCGRCIGCRLDYSRSWADRMLLELETEKKGIFVTLTYNNEFCPISMLDKDNNPLYYTLDKKHCQLWMKRLRKEFDPIKIRFYLAGEYGSKTFRPHYHAIIFGVGLDDFVDKKPIGRNELGQIYYTSERLQSTWRDPVSKKDIGYVLLSDVSWKTCAYVARYVTKKLNGDQEIVYAYRNSEKEFSLMSRKPGIGKRYLEEHPDIFDKPNIILSTEDGGKKVNIPKYFYNQLKLTEPDRYDKLMKEKKDLAEDRMLIELQHTDLSLTEYLEVKEMKKIEQSKRLKRDHVD